MKMPDNITITDGRAEMMYVGETPWHRLGNKLDNPATAEEAIAAAGLDWEVQQRPVYYYQSGILTKAKGDRAVIREDTGAKLKILSKAYQPVQNHEAFSFFDTVVGEGQAIYHTAGSLQGGRKIWILARLPHQIEVTDSDVLQCYILLSNSHDGSTSVRMRPTTVRVVCANTLSVALREKNQAEWSTSHRGDIMTRVNQAREMLSLQEAHFRAMMESIEKLADEKMKEADTENFYRDLFDIDDAADHNKSRQAVKVDELFRTGRGNSGETRWDMLNAITEWVDHKRGKDENRLHSAWFGSGNEIKRRAWNILTV